MEALTPRQKELFDMLLKGIPPKEIAYNLNIAYNTLLFHQKKLYQRLGVHNIKEFMAKYSPGTNGGAVKAVESGTITIRKNVLFGTLGILSGLLITSVVFLSILIFKEKPIIDEGLPAVFIHYDTYLDDKGSFINKEIKNTHDIIKGKVKTTYNISGVLSDKTDENDKSNRYAGLHLYPTSLTLEDIKKMTYFSFNFVGDGHNYLVNVPTTDSLYNDHYGMIFSTVDGEVSTLNVNVDDLKQMGYGTKFPFIRDNILFFEFGTAEGRDSFNLKIWDIRIYDTPPPHRRRK
jgi:DNA-binding CsgD family transcriptional regulator